MIIRSQFKRWKWKYTKNEAYIIPLKAVVNATDTFFINSKNSTRLVTLAGNLLTIHRHYHFDGATHAPDIKSGLKWYAQHDAMIQLHQKYPSIISREMADSVLDPRLRSSPLHLWLYYPAVRAYSTLTK